MRIKYTTDPARFTRGITIDEWAEKGIKAGSTIHIHNRLKPRPGDLFSYTDLDGDEHHYNELVKENDKTLRVIGGEGDAVNVRKKRIIVLGRIISIEHKKVQTTYTVPVTKAWPAEGLEVGDQVKVRAGKVKSGDLALCQYRHRNLIGYVYLDNASAVRIVGRNGKSTSYARSECEVIGRIHKIVKLAKPDPAQPFTDEQAEQLVELRHELAHLAHTPENAVRRAEILKQIKKLESAADLNK